MEVSVQVKRCKKRLFSWKNKVASFFLPVELTATQKLDISGSKLLHLFIYSKHASAELVWGSRIGTWPCVREAQPRCLLSDHLNLPAGKFKNKAVGAIGAITTSPLLHLVSAAWHAYQLLVWSQMSRITLFQVKLSLTLINRRDKFDRLQQHLLWP